MNWSAVWVTCAFPASWEVVQARRHFQEGESPPRNHREEGNSLFQNDTSKPQMVVSAALDAPWTLGTPHILPNLWNQRSNTCRCSRANANPKQHIATPRRTCRSVFR